MPNSNAAWEEQLDRTLRVRYRAPLMNNTKWREVWIIVSKLKLRVQMDYADSPGYGGASSQHGPFSQDDIQERGIRDPGIGGPFLYKQILWLRIPKVWGNDVEAFKTEVQNLGVIAMTETTDFVEIRGYDLATG